MSLLLIAGIEPNPSSNSEASTSSSRSNLSLDSDDLNIIKDKFSVVHYNVQSISNKIDILESELRNFDIICLTETWPDERALNDTISLNEYNVYRRDRVGDNHGHHETKRSIAPQTGY